jgi:hypothetical protein
MTIDQLIPAVSRLSHEEKIRLAQIILQQLAQEETAPTLAKPPTIEHFDPQRFYGAAQYSKQEIDHYLASAREGWS